MKIHHIGIATRSIEQSLDKLKLLYEIKNISEIVFDKNQNAKLCIVDVENGVSLELIEGDQVKHLVKKGINYYHIGYSVKNIYEKIDQLQQKGALLVSEPKEAILFNNRLVAFLMTNDGLIELIEE